MASAFDPRAWYGDELIRWFIPPWMCFVFMGFRLELAVWEGLLLEHIYSTIVEG